MAVDLTPRFRRLNSQTRSFRDNLHCRGVAGPFGATQLWHNIIRALRAQVEVRRRRRHLRVHANSFSGADAVDAVLSYLMQNAAFGGGGGELSRLTAARLCQALMEARVFEPVGGKLFRRDKETTFEDGGGSLYRFLECKEQECDSDTHEEIKMKMKRNKHSRLNDVHTIANPLAAGPDKKVETLLRSINLRPSPPSTASPSLPQTAVEEVWRRKALLQLLQTMELPVLDGILASPAGVHAGARRAPLQDLVIPNTCLERDLPDALNLPKWDGWLSAAADCLEFLPDQLIAAAGEHLRREGGDGTPERAKRLLFDAIAKHYDGGETAPLLSGRYQDVLVGIVEMLEQARVQRAIRASQLCLHLLQSSTRDELRRLLAFMAAAACPRACRLQRQVDNRTVVCRAFQKAVVHNGQLTRAQSETLVLFLVDNHTDLFKTPTSLTEAVHRTLRSMREGKDADSVATIAFCEQVTAQEYRKRRDRATHESLARLLLHVASSPASGREKRRRLKRFEKHHPVVFLRHLRSNI
ncbi:DEP domain-containing protein 4 [Syngnathoides biaculeatus]|uniref:DEP domain-containing protein 4 n=1 Tax=Syngnathoides biaculeatus TaxID=300417 RepID=UPI002ADDF9A9|nr:DEP domain-containing protein 4 [Syngnathoides biaculeatus]